MWLIWLTKYRKKKGLNALYAVPGNWDCEWSLGYLSLWDVMHIMVLVDIMEMTSMMGTTATMTLKDITSSRTNFTFWKVNLFSEYYSYFPEIELILAKKVSGKLLERNICKNLAPQQITRSKSGLWKARLRKYHYSTTKILKLCPLQYRTSLKSHKKNHTIQQTKNKNLQLSISRSFHLCASGEWDVKSLTITKIEPLNRYHSMSDTSEDFGKTIRAKHPHF